MIIKDINDISVLLSMQMKSRELSTRKLAADIGVSNQTISNLIHGYCKNVSVTTVIKLLKRFDMYLVAKEDMLT